MNTGIDQSQIANSRLRACCPSAMNPFISMFMPTRRKAGRFGRTCAVKSKSGSAMQVGGTGEDKSSTDGLWASDPCILKRINKWIIGIATAWWVSATKERLWLNTGSPMHLALGRLKSNIVGTTDNMTIVLLNNSYPYLTNFWCSYEVLWFWEKKLNHKYPRMPAVNEANNIAILDAVIISLLPI